MKIKYKEEDFLVEEIPLLEFGTKENKYSYFLLNKNGKNTSDVINEICRHLRIHNKFIGFAGNKDKTAITSQYISIMTNIFEIKDIESFKIEGVSLKFAGYGSERINLGDLKGNRFVITVRQLNDEKELNPGKIKNYFGEQRFGKNNLNSSIGKCLVKKNFRKVCELLSIKPNGNNFIEAIKGLDVRLLRLYVNAYQSMLWNEAARKIKNADEVEVIGFLTEFENEDVKKIYGEIMKNEDIHKEEFLIKQIKEISMEGTKRKLFLDVKDFSYKWSDDELFPGKKKCVVSFCLDKGCYATVVIESLFG
ncbi:MAG: tRNA pseudouridine(13) synthase TruD [Nanoarchaeota archaeon]|nr:tRNA pseudouridine(13) synthase TruD [Nanoarchaeota archaeon]